MKSPLLKVTASICFTCRSRVESLMQSQRLENGIVCGWRRLLDAPQLERGFVLCSHEREPVRHPRWGGGRQVSKRQVR